MHKIHIVEFCHSWSAVHSSVCWTTVFDFFVTQLRVDACIVIVLCRIMIVVGGDIPLFVAGIDVIVVEMIPLMVYHANLSFSCLELATIPRGSKATCSWLLRVSSSCSSSASITFWSDLTISKKSVNSQNTTNSVVNVDQALLIFACLVLARIEFNQDEQAT